MLILDDRDSTRDPVPWTFLTPRVRERIVPSGRPLDAHERHAFADVVRIWLGQPMRPPQEVLRKVVTRHPRACHGCGGSGVRLKYRNLCLRCYSALLEV